MKAGPPPTTSNVPTPPSPLYFSVNGIWKTSLRKYRSSSFVIKGTVDVILFDPWYAGFTMPVFKYFFNQVLVFHTETLLFSVAVFI